MAATDTLNLEMPGMATLRLYGDLQRFGKRFDLSIKTAAEGLHALYLQIPGLRQRIQEGWYQVRIAGKDVTPDDVTARLHEPLPSGAVIHIVPRMEGAKNAGIFQVVVGAVLTVVGIVTSWTGVGAAVGAAGIAMMAGGVVQMLTPTPKSPSSSHADNGKASVYFSSVDNMIAQGNPVPIPYGEIMCGSRVISQEITTRDESSPDKVINFGSSKSLTGAMGNALMGKDITKPRVLIR
ncbi:tail assembly protein [Salmonella enterica]|nr:tail assembly protein [Salmonella enterica]ELD3568669.1 tail assembly protein [Salmonella enterica]